VYGNSLQVLRTHHRAAAAARGGAEAVNDHRGVQHAVFPGRPDDNGLHIKISQFVLDHLVGLISVFAPEFGGVADFDLVVHYGEVHGFRGLAFDNDAVPTGPLEFVARVAADLGMAVDAGQRAFEGDVEPGRRAGGSVQRAGQKAQQVFGGKRIRLGFEVFIQKVGAESYAAHIGLIDAVIHVLHAVLAGGQINFQQLAEITTLGCCHGDYLLFPSLLG